MSRTPNKQEMQSPSAAVRAEAAAWIARLHGPNRTPEVEAGFRRWLAERPERAAAVELMTDTWEKSVRLRRRPIERLARLELPGFRLSFSRAAVATVAIAAVAILGTLFYLRPEGVATGVGEQRTLSLRDGTRIYLNTGTRIIEHYDEKFRRVEIEKGEAMFEVAKQPAWPFIVTAGDRQVRALGTTFIVRREAEQLAVTLVEGRVTVSSTSAPARSPEQADSRGTLESVSGAQLPATVTLTPGERLTLKSIKPPKIDRPSIEKVTAWQRGQVALDNVPLVDAITEMNRYSETHLVVDDPFVAAIKVSGIFRAGDQENFARAVAHVYRLEIRSGPKEIVLGGNGIPSGAR
jgi:transmembrane sensor